MKGKIVPLLLLCLWLPRCHWPAGSTAPADLEVRYSYWSGGLPADHYVGIEVMIAGTEGELVRKEVPAGNHGLNRVRRIGFPLGDVDRAVLCGLFRTNGFFSMRTGRVMHYDARTVAFTVKAGGRTWTRTESPTESLSTENDRKRFFTLEREFVAFLKGKLPADAGDLIEH
jgi:hypothetical protein